MLQRPACSDPSEISGLLWAGWGGKLAFDVGANCGQSIPVLGARFTKVVAFEPAAESWEVLYRDYGEHPAVRLVHQAVTDVDGVIDLYETPGNLEQGQLISPGHHAFTREVAEPAARAVRCLTLDSAAAEYGTPDFVKVDTEGHELRVLEGAPAVLAGGGTGWLIEFHSPLQHDGCEGLLAGSGLRVETVRHPHYPAGTEDWFNHGWLRATPG